MTMKRNAKATHQDLILGADDADPVDATFAYDGRPMNRLQYIANRMGRGTIGVDQAEGMREARRRYRRRPVRR